MRHIAISLKNVSVYHLLPILVFVTENTTVYHAVYITQHLAIY